MLISMAIQWRLRSKFREYSQIGLSSGLSGQEIAQRMLRDHGINDVQVISTEGELTDHYNPANKTVNLSREVYLGRSAAAAAVAAHECGHAVQHATAYSMLQLRSALVPIQNISANIINIIFMAMLFGAFFLRGLVSPQLAIMVIIACYAVFSLFALVTLPVEFDASRRALAWIDQKSIVTSREHAMAKDALKWAASTYVVAALGALAQLWYYVSLLTGSSDD